MTGPDTPPLPPLPSAADRVAIFDAAWEEHYATAEYPMCETARALVMAGAGASAALRDQLARDDIAHRGEVAVITAERDAAIRRAERAEAVLAVMCGQLTVARETIDEVIERGLA